MSNKENITKILLLGETGVGKSSLGNYIIGKKEFLSRGGARRVTTQIGGKISEREQYKDIFIIDTPGSQDTELEDSHYLEELKNNFKDRNAGVRAILMLISFQNPRFTDYLQKQIRIYCNLFLIEDFWEHVSIVFTKAYYYTPKTDFDSIKQDLESDNGLINLIMDYIKEETEKINESKKNDTDFKKIKAPCKLPVFFIDSTLEIEEKKNIRTKEEVNKLIEWARIKEYLDLQNINKNKIDVNYLSTERIEDIIPEEEEKFLEGSSNKLKIYSKKVFAQYKKITFHNEIVFIKDPEPYKIEEIKEEEILSPKKCISSQENKNGKIDIYEIEHLAIKSKKRVIENGHNKEWEDNTNQSDLESSRIISKDKIEENYKYELIEENSDSDKTIEKYNYVKITKYFINGEEQKNEEKKEKIYTEKRTKKIVIDQTEKKPYKDKKDMKYSETIIREETLIELDNGTPPKEKQKEIKREKHFENCNRL